MRHVITLVLLKRFVSYEMRFDDAISGGDIELRKQNQFVELKLIVPLKISSFIIEMLNICILQGRGAWWVVEA